MRIKISKTVVPYKLTRELIAAGVPLLAPVALLPKDGLYIPILQADEVLYIDIINTVIDAHDGIDDIAVLKADAEQRIKNIPNWATWTETEAQTWFIENIDPLNIPDEIKNLLRNYGRILLALRDKTWPEL